MFYKSGRLAVATTAALVGMMPNTLNMNETSSIRGVAKTIAAGAMSYYSGTPQAFADLPQPYYWWECGALMGAMLDYSHYVGDNEYDQSIATALLAQVGPNYDYMLPAHFGDEGNDDLGFWGFAVMAAAERNFPQPNATIPSWLELGSNIFNSLASRWNTSSCGGGLMWQIFPSNPNGMHYKNSVSNGGLFQIAARLARATGNETYVQWAEKVWDWTTGIGLIDADFNVYDGADTKDDCAETNYLSFSYSHGIYLYGAAVMANHTGDQKWADRATRLLDSSASFFGGPEKNMTNVMYEHACEQVETCSTDMKSFKGYMSRFMYQSTLMQASLIPKVNEFMSASATAAAQACTGGTNQTTCGQKWYVGGFDGSVGLGQEMCALETIQGLLVTGSAPPLKGDDIKVVRTFSSPSVSSTPSVPSSTAVSEPTKRDNAAGVLRADLRWTVLGSVMSALLWGMI